MPPAPQTGKVEVKPTRLEKFAGENMVIISSQKEILINAKVFYAYNI